MSRSVFITVMKVFVLWGIIATILVIDFSHVTIISLKQIPQNSYADDVLRIECRNMSYRGADVLYAEYSHSANELSLVGKKFGKSEREGKIFAIQKIKLSKKVVGVTTDISCSNNKIVLEQKWAFRTLFITQAFEWDGRELNQVETKYRDPSEDDLAAATNYALEGNLDGARAKLGAIMYPQHYLAAGSATHVIQQGHRKALELYKHKKSQEAAIVLKTIFDFSAEMYAGFVPSIKSNAQFEPDKIHVPNRWLEAWKGYGIEPRIYIAPLNDLGFFLQQLGNNEEAIPILRAVIEEDPKRPAAYLNISDALWALNRKEEAKPYMKEYLGLMAEFNKSDKVPERVKLRLESK